MKWFTKKKGNEESVSINESTASDEEEFQPFHNTFKLITFTLSYGMMYPNANTRKARFFLILLVIVTSAPIESLMLRDMFCSWLKGEYIEMIRQSTMAGPFLGVYLKMFLMLLKYDSSEALIDEFNRDYSLYNHAPPEYKAIIREHIQNCRTYTEKCWSLNVITCVMTFPLMAVVSTAYSHLFTDEPRKYMIHDVNDPFSDNPEDRLKSPFYEFAFLYELYCGWLYVVNFTSYDGFYGLCVNHVILKITLYCKALEDCTQLKDIKQVYEGIVGVIEEQNRTFRFIQLIQETFEIWLGVIFLATMIQLCNLLYHINAGYGLDLRYAVFIIAVSIHIYLPCHYGAKLKSKSLEAATLMYCSGWERVRDLGLRNMLRFMIARAQITNSITAFNMITFDMELFVSILQTSYSMYTLLSS